LRTSKATDGAVGDGAARDWKVLGMVLTAPASFAGAAKVKR
jgi:hypothetical protein